jgi:hypothetical protein
MKERMIWKGKRKNKMYSINKKLIEEGKIELLKNTLNELELFCGLKDDSSNIKVMKQIIIKYDLIKNSGDEINSQDYTEYDNKLKEIIMASRKAHAFY